MHDSTELEKRGIPTVTICSDQFAFLARSVAKVKGLPELSLVIIPHPLGGLTPDKVRAKADAALDDIVALLTRPKVKAAR